MSDQGWRRGDEAAWWDGDQRRWRRGTLTARHTVPAFVYEVTAEDGTSVAVPERLLRSIEDPAVTPGAPSATHPAAEPGTAPPVRSAPPPVRPGASLADRARR